MFRRYGRIVEIRVNRDRFTGRCKGFGFVAMSREEEVDEVSQGGGFKRKGGHEGGRRGG
jgi:RNA recognition motif-containing protein